MITSYVWFSFQRIKEYRMSNILQSKKSLSVCNIELPVTLPTDQTWPKMSNDVRLTFANPKAKLTSQYYKVHCKKYITEFYCDLFLQIFHVKVLFSFHHIFTYFLNTMKNHQITEQNCKFPRKHENHVILLEELFHSIFLSPSCKKSSAF